MSRLLYSFKQAAVSHPKAQAATTRRDPQAAATVRELQVIHTPSLWSLACFAQ
jgi:hypothetical protein